ncbi:MAG: NADH-ubiquinone oxidoreductase-F iron-sulfur binding region domain-containing protein [Acidimicrobiales bacterium]
MSVAAIDHCADRDVVGVARVGGESGRLLAGPSGAHAELLVSHLDRLGPLDARGRSAGELRALIREAGIVGRGGGEFPLSRKLDRATLTSGTPLVIVNASESEPASRKDATLLSRRPHLVLDGAEIVASAVCARDVIIYLHSGDVANRVRHAVHERHGPSSTRFHLVLAPDRYVAGEASAVVSFLTSGVALPQFRTASTAAPVVSGRPTVLSNTETYAHVALLARHGAQWFRACGSKEVPGSTLVTLAGAVPQPGLVLEMVGPITFGEVLGDEAGVDRKPRAILVGGYAGTWIDGAAAWSATIDRHWLRQAGAPLGCGLVAVLGHEQCGLAETSRLLSWMANQSSGQCGPCVSGLPAIAALAHDLAIGVATRRDVVRLRQLAVSVRGRGACGHPTGTAMLLESALEIFEPETHAHLKGRSCHARGTGLPLMTDRHLS